MFLAQRRLRRRIDGERVRRAIAEAEARTSAQIRVSLAPFFWGDVRRVADLAFERLGMRATRQRNGVLIFLVPSRRRFAVLGDEGIHAKVGQGFWEDVAAAMEERFRRGDFTAGLVQGIETVGRELAIHFPFDAASAQNELSDDLDLGG